MLFLRLFKLFANKCMTSSPGSLEDKLRQTLSRARLCLTPLPLTPSINLHLYDTTVLEGPISHDEAQAVVAEPAYWSFCWASGQVLAQYILHHPECVKGKRVLDFGSGSGVVAIAAAMAQASEVIACDIDRDALEAVRVNADTNHVNMTLLSDFQLLKEPIDVIVAADVLYDRDNYGLLEVFKTKCSEMLLADSRVKELPSDGFKLVDTIEGRTHPDLNEFEEFNQVRIYTWQESH